MLVPLCIAKLTKASRRAELLTSAALDPFKSVAMQRTSELLAACASHLINFLGCLSLFAVTCHLFYRDEQDRTWQYFLERTVLMLAVGMGAVFFEKVLLHFLAIEFHRSLYQERVFKSMYSQWVLSTLRSFINSSNHPWTRKQFPHRNTDDLMAAFLLENVTLTTNTTTTNNKSLSSKSYQERDQLIKGLFKALDSDGSAGFLRQSDLEKIFGDEDARKALELLADKKSTEEKSQVENTSQSASVTVNREILRKSIQAINQDRWDLVRALNTHANIIKKLDRVMLGFIFSVLLYFSPVLGYQLDQSNIFNFGVTLAPLVISFTEFFGDPLKRICEAIIYIVTCHPYDVGDRVSIDGIDFFVQKIGLVSTTFKRFDGFMVWYPNYVLARKALCNIRRTGHQAQRLEIHVDASTPMERLQLLSSSVSEFIRNDTKDFEAVIAAYFDMQLVENRIVLVFLLRHRFNFQDAAQRAERQNRFLLFLKGKVEKLGIDYRPPKLRALLDSDQQFLLQRSDAKDESLTTL